MLTGLVVVLSGALVGFAGPAVAGPPRESAPVSRVCFSQLDGTASEMVPSQNFEPSEDAFDSVAADDVRVKRRCRARAVTALGWVGNASGVARSETVTFYRDKGGRPGRVIHSETVVGETEDNERYDITLDHAVRLRPGRIYWVSVQINMDFASDGMWQWFARDAAQGKPGRWMNPGDGFGTGCTDWATFATCFGVDTPDLALEVRTR